MSNTKLNGHAVPSPGSTILHVPPAVAPQQPQAVAPPQTVPLGVAPQVTQVPQAAPAAVAAPAPPPIQVMPVGLPVRAPQGPAGAPNPVAGVPKIMQENKRELLFAGAGAFLATMFAQGKVPRFPGGGGRNT